MFVTDMINDFLESLEVEAGRSRYTTRNYELYLERLIEFGGEELKPSDIDEEWLRKYRLWLNRYQNKKKKGCAFMNDNNREYISIGANSQPQQTARVKKKSLLSKLLHTC